MGDGTAEVWIAMGGCDVACWWIAHWFDMAHVMLAHWIDVAFGEDPLLAWLSGGGFKERQDAV
jgi:hypothetical protein